jgi:excisionase family DNA binding protein
MHQLMQGAKAPEPVTEQRMLSSAELADYLQLTEETVRRLARRGTIPSVTVARRIRFDLAAVLKSLEGEQ